jgi:hypothetical protein
MWITHKESPWNTILGRPQTGGCGSKDWSAVLAYGLQSHVDPPLRHLAEVLHILRAAHEE